LAERKILDDQIRSRTERGEERPDDRLGKGRHYVTVALFVCAVTAESEPAFEVPGRRLMPAIRPENASKRIVRHHSPRGYAYRGEIRKSCRRHRARVQRR
jgi:hypothetical protein